MSASFGRHMCDWWHRDRRLSDPLVILFIISMGIVLNPIVLCDYALPYAFQVVIPIFWVVLAFLKLIREHYATRKAGCQHDRSWTAFVSLIQSYAFPKLLIWGYGILLFIIGIADKSYASSGYTQIISLLLPIVALYLFKGKTVHYIYYACVFSFIPVVILTCKVEGIDSLLAPFRAIMDPQFVNPFENHQFTFTTAYLFVYYLYVRDRLNGRAIVPMVLAGVMTFMGFKRILVLSICVVLFIHFLMRKMTERGKRRICHLVSWGLAAICVLYISLIYACHSLDLTDELGILSMGRIYYYKIVVDNTMFGPSFLGIGLNAVSRMLTQDYSYLGVGGVHSDVLKYYAEIGFIGFLFWLWAYLFKIPRYLEKHFGLNPACAVCLINILTFIAFLTDNIDIYFGSQFLFIAIPITVSMSQINNETTNEQLVRRLHPEEI